MAPSRSTREPEAAETGDREVVVSDTWYAVAGQFVSDLFISYARKDQAFVRRLHDALAARGKEAWVDWEDIPASAKWLDELRGAVEAADAFAFVISPDSVASAYCRQEAEHALAAGKRIVPVVWREVDAAQVPEGVSAHNWISMREGDDFEAGVDTLVNALDTDLEWVHAHTRLLTRALEWDRAKRDPSFLLRGRDLEAAESWLSSGTESRNPRPTPLMTEYVIASRRGATRGQRMRVGALSVGLVVALVLTVFSLVQLNEAVAQRTRAEEQTRVATGRELAAASASQLSIDPELSLLLAIKGMETSSSLETDQALRTALQESRVRRSVATGRPVMVAAFSSDARRVLTGGADGTLDVWDTANGSGVWHVKGSGAPVRAVALSSDGARAVSAGDDGVVRLWELGGTVPTREISTNAGSVTSLAIDSAGLRVLVTGDAGFAEIWDLSTGVKLHALDSGSDPVASGAFSPDGSKVATGSATGRVRIFNSATGELIRTSEGQKGTIGTLAWSRDGALLASGCTDGTVRVWDAANGDVVAETTSTTSAGQLAAPVVGPGGFISSVAFDPAGTQLLTTSEDSTALVWTADTGALVVALRRHQGPVIAGAFSGDGRQVVTLGADGIIRTWSAVGTDPRITLRAGHLDRVAAIAYSPDGSRIVTASWDGTARVWDAGSGQSLAKFKGQEAQIEAIAYSPNGLQLVTAGTDGSVRIWDATNGAVLHQLHGPPGIGPPALAPNVDVAFARDGRGVVETNPTDTRVWDVSSGELVATFPLPGSAVDVSPDGATIAIGGTDFVVRIVDAATGAVRLSLVGHADAIEAVEFDPTGKRLITASADGTARIWDLRTGTVIAVLSSNNHVTDATWNRDGSRVATAHFDGRARVWDPETGELLGTYQFEVYAMRAVVFSPDGKSLVGSHLDSAWLIDCDVCGSSADVLALAHARVTRDLTTAEQGQFLHLSAVPSLAPSPSRSASPQPPGGSPGPSGSVAPSPSSTEPPAATAPSAVPSNSDGSMDLCVAGRSSCDLAPGTYGPSQFRPSVRFALQSGWQNLGEGESTFALSYRGGDGYLQLLTGVTQGFRFGKTVAIAPGSSSFIAYLQAIRNLVVSAPAPTTVGGIQAMSVDLSYKSGDDAVDLFLFGNGGYTIIPGERIRLLALDISGKTLLVIEDVPDGELFDELSPVYEQVVSSLRFV